MAIFPRQGRPDRLLGRLLIGRPRLFVSILVTIIVYAVTPSSVLPVTRALIAWNIGTWLYIALYLVMMATSDDKTIRWRANITDEGQFVILALAAVAAMASIVAIVAQLSITKDMKGLDKGLHLGLAGLTIVSAWVFIHLTFAIHYAHQFFDEHKTQDGEKATLHGGLNFPDTSEPDYWDFLYFSFIIGVASQTADVSITSKTIRRTSLAHSVLAFFFNSAILALTINIAAGLI